MAAPKVHFALPSLGYLQFKPTAQIPPALPPPREEAHFRSPLAISSSTYNGALNPVVPLAFTAVYIILAFTGNAYNRRRGHKPWRISQNAIFRAFVIIHNAALAIYSITTCVALVRSLTASAVAPNGKNGFAGTVDSLCKMHGPRGYGDAITYDPRREKWQSRNPSIHLGGDGLTPDTTDVGRIWNEGLAFWGWLFYLSKFYEVVDTAIILAKGRRSSTLQIYHHTGAIFSLWAGIGYMSPPIWMFVMVNAGVHGLMYTYYTLVALGIRVNKSLKQALTVLQISQFVVGVSYASAHLFVSYDVSVSIAYTVASSFVEPPRNVVSDISQATLETAPWLKKLAFLALNAPGLAHNVRNDEGARFGLGADTVVSKEQTYYHTRTDEVRCLDTNGQVFAILLNLMYLLPLTVLFLQFFAKTYSRIPTPSFISSPKANFRKLSDSATTAAEKTTKTIESGGKKIEGEEDDAVVDDESASGQVSSVDKGDEQSAKDIVDSTARTVKEKASAAGSKVEAAGKDVTHGIAEVTKTVVNKVSEKFEKTGQDIVENGESEESAAADSLDEHQVAEEESASPEADTSRNEESMQTKQPSQTHVEEADLDGADTSTAKEAVTALEKADAANVEKPAGTPTEESQQDTSEPRGSPASIRGEDSMGPEGSASAEFVKVEKGEEDAATAGTSTSPDTKIDANGDQHTNKPDGAAAVKGDDEAAKEAGDVNTAKPDDQVNGSEPQEAEGAEREEAEGSSKAPKESVEGTEKLSSQEDGNEGTVSHKENDAPLGSAKEQEEEHEEDGADLLSKPNS
ncbi:MAG: hypothetical protein M1828_001245 [Chrysothrix sp. TS-e1954]|nr:MAG: hypothetical protein M1828_001245 [Chrysothrix sp. TS-e1954]